MSTAAPGTTYFAPRKRHYYLDNLRSFTVLVVIVFHAALAFMVYCPSWWPVIDPQQNVFFLGVVMLTDVPIMPIMFIVAMPAAAEAGLCRVIGQPTLEAVSTSGLSAMMPSSRKGRNRKIQRKPLPISPRLAVVLRQATIGRAPEAPLLDPIRILSERFRTATKHLGLDPAATPYALRHSSFVRMLLNNVPVRVVASHHDTSVEMIERHYSRYITDVSDALTRRTLLDFAAPAPVATNVITLARVVAT